MIINVFESTPKISLSTSSSSTDDAFTHTGISLGHVPDDEHEIGFVLSSEISYPSSHENVHVNEFDAPPPSQFAPAIVPDAFTITGSHVFSSHDARDANAPFVHSPGDVHVYPKLASRPHDSPCETVAPFAHSDEPDHVPASLAILGSVQGFVSDVVKTHVGSVSHVPSGLHAIGLTPLTA